MARLTLKNGSVVNLDLQENEDGSVVVIARDNVGMRITASFLLVFKPSGYIFRETSVTKGLGFSLNEDGRIRTSKHCRCVIK